MSPNPEFDDNPSYQPSIKECARQGRPFIDLPYEPDSPLRDALVHILRNTKETIHPRLQLTTLYIDYRYYQLHGEQFTNAGYTPNLHGGFSKEIKRELEAGPFRETITYYDGKSYTSYRLGNGVEHEIDTDVEVFLDQMLYELDGVPFDQLLDWAKNIPLFDHVKYGETAEFNDRRVKSMGEYRI